MWKPERLTRQEIELRADRLLSRPLIARVGKRRLLEIGLRFSDLYEQIIWPQYRVIIRENVDLSGYCDGGGALGVYHPASNVVEIDRSLAEDAGDPRRTFTLYHEVVGHAVLQGEWLRAQLRAAKGSHTFVETDETIDPRNRETFEWQANTMAGLTAAPQWLVDAQLILRLEPHGRPLTYCGPGCYYLGSRASTRRFEVISFEDYTKALAAIIHPWFGGLSKEALGYRIQRSCLVRDATLKEPFLYRVRSPQHENRRVTLDQQRRQRVGLTRTDGSRKSARRCGIEFSYR